MLPPTEPRLRSDSAGSLIKMTPHLILWRVCETEREGWWRGGGLCEKALSLSFSTWNVLLGCFNKLAIKLSVKC